MVDVPRLKAVLRDNHVSVEHAARVIGVNPSTLYRRFNSDNAIFTVNEVDKLATLLNLDINTLQDIFFSKRFA